jgi:hypothetical protein
MPKDLSIAEETTKLGPPVEGGENSSFMILTTGNSSPYLLFASRVSRVLTTVTAGCATKLQPSPQFLKKSPPLLASFF